ncbi:hypothetical protein OC846_004777 [Tilletia horrida]|uniref:dihydrolipoyllysine-residue succinyltransferase n=1 Tax=Tilletia horrida TaxID=155126 RepID=A0AAN6GLZ6_9BASI|nr:hypothetical protein OC845_005017 [Tilletia horrida]KAK0547637.1 hypothetical protein OC846_004777 [Tilletia horrida]KAK0562673.1 hypothetical protein OC861_005197 [Tilletia horrida]
MIARRSALKAVHTAVTSSASAASLTAGKAATLHGPSLLKARSIITTSSTSSHIASQQRRDLSVTLTCRLNAARSFSTSSIAQGVVKVPQMAESISEGTLKQWTKKKGDFVKADEEIATIETDKIDVSVNAPESGTIVETYANEEDTVTVGQDLLKIEPGDAPAEGSSSGSGSDESKGQGKEESKGKDEDESKGKDEAEEQHEKKDREISGEGKDKGEQQSKLAKPESGAGGDNRPGSDSKSEGKSSGTDSKPKQPEQQPSKQPKPAPSSSSSSGPSKTPAKSGQVDTTGSAKEGSRTERRVKMSRMRLRIAERLKQSQNTAASLTTFNEIDMSALMAFRSRHKDRVLKDHGVKLGFMSAFAKASAQALKEIPAANASIEGDGLGDTIVYRDFVDLSVAVSTDKGLVTPVVRNVETMSLIEIERAIADLGKKARDNKLTLEDMAGGTFTISNGGVFGSLFGTPILNLPGSAILGMHAIKEKAWVVNGKVEIRPIMVVALTYDHRLLDGREAVTFLVRLKEYLEDMPSLLL